MATLNFKLRSYNDDYRGTQSKSIYLVFIYGRKKEFRYSTGLQLRDRDNWNAAKQRVNNVVAEPNAKSINEQLRKLESFFEDRYDELKSSRVEINNQVLRNELDIYLGKKKMHKSPSAYKTLLQCYKFYYTHYSTNPHPTTKRPLAKGTVKSYKTSYDILEEFHNEEYALSYERITLDFYYDFLKFLQDKGFSNNYISNHIKMLKTIMNYAWEHKFHNNLDFKSKSFSKTEEEVHNIYLTTGELKTINQLTLTGRMDNARDLFIIASNTGLRVSDFNRLTKENIKSKDGTNYIEIKSQKTKGTVVIPINGIVQKILDKRNGSPPYKMPDQNINMLLKKIARKAKLNDMIRIEKTIGGQKTIIEKPKYDLISSHSGRRSFCTNAYKSGMPTYDIMRISGHKTELSLYRYIRVTPLEALKKVAKHSFFN